MRFPNLLKYASLLLVLHTLTACASARDREKKEHQDSQSFRHFTPDERRSLRVDKQDRQYNDWFERMTE